MDVFVARQPIFDARHRVLGYELLYRRDVVAQAAENGAGNGTYSLMVDALLGLGLSQLTGGRTAYINVSKEMLVEGVADRARRGDRARRPGLGGL
jgi:EAL and modified HD-GYP domain-containing signal transduction protein